MSHHKLDYVPVETSFEDLRTKTFKVYMEEIFKYDFLLINFTSLTQEAKETGELILTIINRRIVGSITTLDFIKGSVNIDPKRYSYLNFPTAKELMYQSSMLMREDPYVGLIWIKDNLLLTNEDGVVIDDELRKEFEKIEKEKENKTEEMKKRENWN